MCPQSRKTEFTSLFPHKAQIFLSYSIFSLLANSSIYSFKILIILLFVSYPPFFKTYSSINSNLVSILSKKEFFFFIVIIRNWRQIIAFWIKNRNTIHIVFFLFSIISAQKKKCVFKRNQLVEGPGGRNLTCRFNFPPFSFFEIKFK